MNYTEANALMEGKQIPLFEISLINKSSRPQIRSYYSLFQSLKQIIEKNNDKTTNNRGNTISKSDKTIFPLLWIDCKVKENSQTSNSINSQGKTQLKHLFEQILSKPIKSYLEKESSSKQSDKKLFSGKKEYRGCSSYKKSTQSSQKGQIKDDKFYVKSKLIETYPDNSLKGQKRKKIMLIHLTVFLNIKLLKKLTQDLISMGSFLAHEIIVNCTQIDTFKENALTSMISSFQTILQDTYLTTKNNTNKRRVHFIGENISNENMTKDNNSFNFYQIKDLSDQREVKECLSELKEKYIQSLDKFNGKEEGFTMKQFVKKYQIASRVLQNHSKNKSKISHFSHSCLFSQQTIKQASEQLSRQHRYSQGRLIREKFEILYNSFLIDSKRSQLPLPEALIKFRIEQVIKAQLKAVSEKDLLQKISLEYETRLMEKNEKQIQRVLITSMNEFLSTIFITKDQINNERQMLFHHPDKISRQISQFIEMMQQTHIFISQTQINKYIFPQIHMGYYKRLYQEYTKMKILINGGQLRNEEMIQQMKDEIESLTKYKEEVQRDTQVTRYCRKDLEHKLQASKKETTRLGDQLIVCKEKYKNCNNQLLDQVKIRKQLQKTIKQLQSTKSGQISLKQGRQSVKSTDLQKLRYSILQQIVCESGKESQNLTKSFEHQLNIYKNQYTKLQNQLRQKSQSIDQKESFYKEKIIMLQKQLSSSKANFNQLIQGLKQKELWRENIKREFETQSQVKLELIKKQTDQGQQKYRRHINELERQKNQKNQQISSLNQLLYTTKKQLISLQDKLIDCERKLKDQDNRIKLQNKDKKISELIKLIEDKNLVISSKANDNLMLTQKIKQKNIRIELLQEDVLRLKMEINDNCQTNNCSSNLSFVRFQKDFIRPLSGQKPCQRSRSSSKLNVNRQETPQKRLSRIKTVTQINENMELHKLIEQRRTIEKKKQRYNNQESLLQKMEIKMLGTNSQLKLNSKDLSNPFSTQKLLNTQQAQRVLKQTNRILSHTNGSQNLLSSFKKLSQCKRKLF